MTKFIKITPPVGFPVTVPDYPSTREHYAKLNSLQKDKSKHYKIENVDEPKPEPEQGNPTPIAPVNPIPKTTKK